MARLALLVFVSLAPAACAAGSGRAPSIQEPNGAPSPEPAAPPSSQETPARALSAEARETVALLRATLEEDGREGARELLREMVAGLGEPESGEEPRHVAFLLELDRIAEELGSLDESRRLRESVLRHCERTLPADDPDRIGAELSLALTRFGLGDLAGARELFEDVHERRSRLLPPDHPDLLAAELNLAATRNALGDLAGARELLEHVLERRTSLLPPDHPDLLLAKQNLAATRRALGDLQGAHELFEDVLERRTRLLPADHPDLLMAMQNIATTKYGLGDLQGAHELFEQVAERWTRLLPPDHPDLLAAKLNLALTRRELGDLAGAQELEEDVLERRTRLLPPDHPDLLAAKLSLAGTRAGLGDLEGAQELEEDVVECWTRLFPPDHPDLLRSKLNLAVTRKELGDLAGARELEEDVLERWSRLLPPDHPHLLAAKLNLAATRFELGDLAGARVLQMDVIERWSRLLPPNHPDLLTAKQNLAATRFELGDLASARQIQEEVLERRTRLLPPDHPDLLTAKLNLAVTREALGDLASARELGEDVLERRTRLLPPDHPDLLVAKLSLARTRKALGDLAGARELEEEVLERRTRLLPPDHPDLLRSKLNLAQTRAGLGDLAGARELEEDVLERRCRLLPPDHPGLLAAKQNLSVTRAALGDLAGARELEEDVHERRNRLLPSDHPDLLTAKQNLAATRYELGDIQGAHELFEDVLERRTRLLPPDHPDLLGAKENLASTRKALGDPAGARELVSSLLGGVRTRASVLLAEAARPAREGARTELGRLSKALFLSASADPGLERELFATLESLRLASVASSEAAHAMAAHPELAEDARGIAGIRARLNDLVAAGPEDEEAAEGWRKSLLELVEERDGAERGLRKRLAEAGAFVGEIDADALAARLPSGTAAVSFLVYRRRFEPDPETKETPPSVDSLVAFLVKPGGAVARIELGATAELEAEVGAWRAALGRPLASRGIAGLDAGTGANDLDALGASLRRRILDPILALAGGVRTLHLVLDDVLHLVPLDALPLEQGLVGDRLALHNEVTLARLLRADAPIDGEGALTLAGGLDYEAELGEGAGLRLDASPPPLAGTSDRSGSAATRFAFLPGTTAEAEAIAAVYEETFEREATPLMRTEGTKAALFASAPRTRWLHLATHGWFASEGFKSQLDTLAEQSARASWQRAEETLTGFAPETLCGLALAGANRGRDAVGRVPGILTAEELSSFDLRNCELAVLSACETNVGIRRAGQGIQSLQTALHAAGARTAITSLWKVDDAATRRLFELFYTKLWKERLGKSTALWQAKMALRAEGHPPRDWAGWVLSGDPE